MIRERRNDGKSLQLAIDRNDTAFQPQFFKVIHQKPDAGFFFPDPEDVLMIVLPLFEKGEDVIKIRRCQPVKFVAVSILLEKRIVMVAALLHLLAAEGLLLPAVIDVILAIPLPVKQDLSMIVVLQPVAPVSGHAGEPRRDAV